MTCAHHACSRRVYMHGVCMDHLISTLEAGRRAVQYYAPEDRLTRLVAEMRAA